MALPEPHLIEHAWLRLPDSGAVFLDAELEGGSSGQL